MHTAKYTPEMFAVSDAQSEGGVELIFPDWDRHDRFGILIHEVWGAIGASLMIQGAVSEFFRARRAAKLPDIYPEIYAFHVGRDFGNLSVYDFWPPHKEIVVESHPAVVLQAVNDRAITRLAVPQGPERPYEFIWPEVASARDRIRTCVEYGPSGAVDGADVFIRGADPFVEENTAYNLDALPVLHSYAATELPDEIRWVGSAGARMNATTEAENALARQVHAAKVTDGNASESYRRSNLDTALARLVP